MAKFSLPALPLEEHQPENPPRVLALSLILLPVLCLDARQDFRCGFAGEQEKKQW